MDLFEANKIVGAVLATGLVIFGIGELGDILVEPEPLEKNVYVVAAAEPEAEAKAGEAKAAEAKESEQAEGADVLAMLAGADLDRGRKVAKKCAACHSLDKGGANKIGPHLWGVVGRPKGSAEGFSYSDAIKGLGGDWSFKDLDHFLASPKSFVSGTKMSFAGIKNPEDRAALIAFLRSLSDSPLALPAAN